MTTEERGSSAPPRSASDPVATPADREADALEADVAATESPRGVIVTGMHRSGTSLTTMLIARLGYQVSSNLMKPRGPNPRGNFEDKQLNSFHDRLLAAAGTSWKDARGLRQLRTGDLSVPRAFRDEALSLIDRYDHFESRTWLWKNPRSTLVLPFWADVAPDAVFVGVIRRPAEVVASFLRRKDRFGNPLANPATRFVTALSLWISYNEALLRFAETSPERLSIVSIPEDIELLSGVPVPPSAAEVTSSAEVPTFEPDLLKGGAPWMDYGVKLRPRAEQLYALLRDKAEPHRLEEVLVGGRNP